MPDFLTPDDFNDGLIPDVPLVEPVMEQAMQINPDQHATDMKLSRKTGLDVEVVKSQRATVERDLRMQQFDFNTFGEKNPATEAFFADLAKASLSHDDIENLSGLERAVTPLASMAQATLSIEEGLLRIPQFLEDVARLTSQNVESIGVPRAVNPIRGIEIIASGYRQAISPLTDQFQATRKALPELADPFRRVVDMNVKGDKAFDDALKGEFKPLMDVLTDPEALSTYGANAIPSLLLALSTGGSLPAIMALEGGGELVEQADSQAEKGREIPLEQKVQATIQTAVISGMLEKVGVDYLRKFPQFKKFFKEADDAGVKVADIFKTGIAEGGTEVLQQFNQNIAQKLTYDPEKNLTSGFLQSFIGGAGAGTTISSAGYVSGLQYKKAETAAFNVKNNADANEQNAIDEMNHFASKSATRGRDKDTFREFVQSIDAESSVYIDGEQVQKYMQEKSKQEIADDPALQMLQKKIVESKVISADIAIPVADFATDIAGSEHFNALREHMKINPEGTTPARQAKTEADAKDYVQSVMEEAKGNASQYAEAQDIFATVRDQLIDTGRMTPQQAGVMADIVPAWATVQAKSRGIPVAQVYEESGLKIEGPMTGKMDALSAEALKQDGNVKKIKSFKTEEGKFSTYDIEKDVRGRADMFTVHEDKGGYIIRNVIIPEDMRRKGVATSFYRAMNQESLKKTGKPLRSTRPRTMSNGETVHELSADGIALWDGLVSKGVAVKHGEKDYSFIERQSSGANLLAQSQPVGIVDKVKSFFGGVTSKGTEAKKDESLPLSPSTLAQSQPADLFVAHNLSADNLRHASEIGGLAAPSLAVARAGVSDFTSFGEITLLADKAMLESPRARTFDADVYTPRHPRAIYTIDGKKFDAMLRKLETETSEAGKLEMPSVDDLSQRGPENMLYSTAMRYYFLKGKGKAPKPTKMKVAPFVKKAADLGIKSEYTLANSPEFEPILREHLESEIARLKADPELKDKVDRFTAHWFNEDGTMTQQVLRDNSRTVARYIENNGVDTSAMRADIDKAFRNKKLSEEYQGYITDQFNSIKTGAKIFKGFTNSGSRKYVEYNLENIVKDMTRALQGGEGFNYGAGSLRAKYANEMKTVKQVQARREQVVSPAEFQKIKDESQNKVADALDALRPYYKYDSTNFGYMNDAISAIGEGSKGQREAFNLDDDSRKIISDLVEYLRTLPTEYFETKVGRAVGLSEFDTAIVPNDTPSDVLAMLKDAGVKVKKYKTPEDRTKLIAEQQHLLFQKEDEARGYYDPSQSLIRLTEASDLSTFLHEFAHFMYDMEKKNPDSKMTEKIHQWFKRNAESVAREANGYMGMEGQPIEQASIFPNTPEGAVARTLWTIGADKDSFRMPTSTKKDMNGIANEMKPGKFTIRELETPPEDAARKWKLSFEVDGKMKEVSITEDFDKQVFIDVSSLKEGMGGSDIYQIAASYAHNNGRVFVPDPAGVSKIAVVRRIENLLSAALRYGTTKHLKPSEMEGVNWIEGNDDNNIEQMLKASAEHVAKKFDIVEQLDYDFATKTFIIKGDENEKQAEFTKADFEGLAKRSFARRNAAGEAEAGYGSTTLQRAVLGRAILRQSRSADGRRVLATFEQDFRAAEGPLNRLFYQKTENPADRFYSQLQRSIESAPAKVFTSGKAVSQWLTSNQGKLGIKKEELYWTGINDWLEAQGKVSKEDVMSFLEQGGVKVEEVTLQSHEGRVFSAEGNDEDGYWVYDPDGSREVAGPFEDIFDAEAKAEKMTNEADMRDSSKFASYQLPGGRNYRELLLTLPATKVKLEQWRVTRPTGVSDGIYSDEVNAQKRADEIGGTIEQLDTLNLDGGFRSSHFEQPNILAHIRFNERTDADGKRVLFVEEIQSDWGQKGKKEGFEGRENVNAYSVYVDGNKALTYTTRAEADAHAERALKHNAPDKVEVKEEVVNRAVHGVPSAPFVQDTKSWTALAMKRVISHAVENGFDSVAWTTGEQQAERYDLSKQISRVEYFPENKTLRAFDLSGNRALEETVEPGNIEDYVGKDVAKKLLESETVTTGAGHQKHSIEGDGLKVGGEGMKGFYDGIVPQVANDILKKLGGGKVESIGINGASKTKAIQRDGEFIGDYQARKKAADTTQQPGFTITTELRAKVQAEGLPLFQGGDINQQQGPIAAADVVNYLDNGTSGDLNKDAAIERAVHEQFARGFEKYLMEGKAPSIELHNVFRTFARWLTQLYRSVRGDMKVNLDDEMRQVFGRMLATDEQIAAAEGRAQFAPMFTDAAMAGMTDEEWIDYTKKQETVRDKATETLRDKLIAQLTRQTKTWWKEEKADLIEAEVERLKGEKVYVAIDALRNGNIKLDTASVKEDYSEVRTDKLGRKMTHVNSALTGMVASGGNGVHPDQAAAMLGYMSGDEMIQNIIAAPKIGKLAEDNAQQQMLNKHGDILTDGTIEREADEAFQNEERGKLILEELKVLSKGTRRGTLDRSMLKSLAEENIGKLSFREIQPGKYRNAELRAAQESAAMLAEGNKEGAATAKARQALNYYLGMAATAAKNDTVKIVDRMARYRKKDVREAIQKAGNGYWGQLNKILERFEFRKSATMKQVDEANESLRVWMKARIEEDGDALVLSAAVQDEGYAKHWKNIPYDELVGISDSVKNIEHVARYSNKITRMQEEVDFQTLVQQWTDSIDAKAGDKFISQRTDAVEGRNWGRWAMAQMTKIPYMASWLDGGERAGISHDILVQPFTDAYNEEVKLWAETGRPVMEAIQNRSKDDIKRHNKKVFIPEIKDERNDGNLYGHQIVAVALNTGNAGNLKKMLLGEGWANPDNDAEITFDNPKLQAVLKHMTKSDWELVQMIWNQMDQLYPQLAEVHRRTTGLTPPKVEAVPFSVEVDGETIKMQGGYYPVKYDPNRSFKAEQREDKLNAETESMFGTTGIQATVNASATNERTGYYAPIRLSLDVVPNHLQETIHFITHHDAVRETNKLLRNAKVAEVIKAKLGPEEYAQLKPWLNDIAKDGREAPMKTYWGSILQRLRFGMTLGVMGFKASTGLMQLLGLSNTVGEVGSANVYQSVRSILGSTEDMKNAWEFATANSKVMSHRAQTMDREIKNAMQKIEGKRGFLAAAQEASMKHIALIQTYMVDLPSWHAAYIKGMKEWGDENRAYQYADWVVENIQGSGVTKDMAAIMRNQSQESRMFTMFMTFFSSLWNMQRDLVRGASTGYYSKSTVAAKIMFIYTIPVFAEMLLRGEWGDDDDDESDMQKYLTKLALYPTASVPFVRDVASGIIGDYGYNISPVAQLIEQGTNSVPKLIAAPFTDDEITKSQVKGAVKFVGAVAGIPGVGQAWATGEHLNQVISDGEELTVKELLYGPNRK